MWNALLAHYTDIKSAAGFRQDLDREHENEVLHQRGFRKHKGFKFFCYTAQTKL